MQAKIVPPFRSVEELLYGKSEDDCSSLETQLWKSGCKIDFLTAYDKS